MVLKMPAAAQSAAPQQQAMKLAVGETLRLEGLSLDDRSGRTASAELRRIAVTDSSTRFIVNTGTETRAVTPPARAHFSGQLAGEPESSVFVSIDPEGAMRSIVTREGEVFVSEVSPGSAQRPPVALSRRIDAQDEAAQQPFSCGVTPDFIARENPPPSAALQQKFSNAALQSAPLSAAAPGEQRRADLIIETDHELYLRLGGETQTINYIVDLFAYLNTRYQSEIGTRLNLLGGYIYSTPADPWKRFTAADQLVDLREYWNSGGREAEPRHHVHLLSAKVGGGGVAYLGTLGDRGYGYGVSTGITGEFSASNPQIVWDASVVAHEIGHAFGSDHTHNYDNPYLGSNQGGAIDCCFADSSNSQCGARNGGAGKYGVLPALGRITGGTTGQRGGTIMSYCDNIMPGGFTNIALSFGTNHPYGVNAWRVADVMSASARTNLPLESTVPLDYPLAVSRSGTGTGTVSSVPAGIQCGNDCVGSYAAGTTVTLTALPSSGSAFTGWTGSCTGTVSSCTLSMTGARNVSAAFTPASNSRVVTVTKVGTGKGSISSVPSRLTCGAFDCSMTTASFASTISISITANPVAGSTFTRWGGACSGTAKVCRLAAGKTSLDVTAYFTADDDGGNDGGVLGDPQLFVGQQYRDFLNRVGDTAGVNYWVGELRSGAVSRAALIESFMDNPNFKNRYGPLVRLYTAYFSRIPDYAGLMYWLDQMYPVNGATGQSLSRVSDSFAQSREFIATYGQLDNRRFVERVYLNVLQRAAEPAGWDYWVGRLDAGLARGELMIGFSESAENIQTNSVSNSITMAYAGMLRRTPLASEQARWLADIKAGRASLQSLIDTLLLSPEYASRFP